MITKFSFINIFLSFRLLVYKFSTLNICSYKFRVYVDVKGQIVAQEVFLTLKFILEDQVIKKKKTTSLQKYPDSAL